METRAIITKQGKEFIATHWDGYPECLGKNLINKIKDKDIILVAKERDIDFCSKDVLDLLNKERIQYLINKHKLTEDDIKEGKRKGSLISNKDYEITDISKYGDFPEFQYDLSDGKWRFRTLSGAWVEEPKKGDWFNLSLENIKSFNEDN